MVLALAVIVFPILMAFTAAGVIESPTAATTPTAAGASVILLLILIVFALAVRFMLTVPIAGAEQAGPIAIVKRSWTLSKGHYWRLLALMLLLAVTAVLLILTAGAIGGILAAIVSPDLEPFSLGALVLALFAGVAQAAFTILSSLMIARVYVQVAGGSDAEVSVPASST
jgi:membrane-anchored glycerophosphoryl diester phosphodiesterase (GDPDase)